MNRIRTIDEVNYLFEHFTEPQINQLIKLDLLRPRVAMTVKVMRCYSKQTVRGKMQRYSQVAEDLGISEAYVISLMKGFKKEG